LGKLASYLISCQSPFHHFSSNLQTVKVDLTSFWESARQKTHEILFLDLNQEGYRPASKGSPSKALNAKYFYLYAVDSFVKSRAELNQNF
jgi:hypothetical protein